MPAPSPSPALLKAAAQIALDTGCTVEIEKTTGNVRVLPPAAIPAPSRHEPKEW
jgi:hypothetical protein